MVLHRQSSDLRGQPHPLSRALVAAVALCGALALATSAEARTEQLRWSYTGTVDGFRVHWGTDSGVLTNVQNAGLPSQNSGGDYLFDLTVPDGQTIYVAVSAFRGSEQGPLSVERVRQDNSAQDPPGGGGDPGDPPPPQDPPAPGFVLMTSPTGRVVDGTPLHGMTVNGPVVVFMDVEGVDRVLFSLDGVLQHTEFFGPYSMGRDDGPNNLHPFDFSGLSNGSHEISAEAWIIGAGRETVRATVFVGTTGGPPDNSGGGGSDPPDDPPNDPPDDPPPPVDDTLGQPGRPFLVQ